MSRLPDRFQESIQIARIGSPTFLRRHFCDLPGRAPKPIFEIYGLQFEGQLLEIKVTLLLESVMAIEAVIFWKVIGE